MPGKRNDVEENAADREIAVTRIALAWALVLVILFWITSSPPLTESRSIEFLIRGSLGGDDASTQSGGECGEGTRVIRASLPMPQVFDVARRMMGEAWVDPKPFAMTAWEYCPAAFTAPSTITALRIAYSFPINCETGRAPEGDPSILHPAR